MATSTFTLTLDLGNAEMQEFGHIGRALSDLAAKLTDIGDAAPTGSETGTIRDENGNTVGTWEVTA